VYWLNTGSSTLMTCAASSCTPTVLATGQYFPGALVVLGSTVYWNAFDSTGKICHTWQMPTGGGIPTVWGPCSNGLAASGPRVYGTGNPTNVFEAPLGSGSSPTYIDSSGVTFGSIVASWPNAAWARGASSPTASDGYVSGFTEGASSPNILATGQRSIGLAMDNANVYWSNDQRQGVQGSIVKVPVGGGAVTTVVSGVFAWPIAIDATSVYWLGSVYSASAGAMSGLFKAPK
jgi:hypothetical protein